jgi:hypothetical protein
MNGKSMIDSPPYEFSQDEFNALLRARVIYLATVRKDDSQSNAAPLWFVVAPDSKILVQSSPDSWHTRRIRRGSPVIVWIGKRREVAFSARAELSNERTVIEQIIKDYPKKYLMARLGLHRPTQASFDRGARVAIKITPLHVLPKGFKPQAGAPAPSVTDLQNENR